MNTHYIKEIKNGMSLLGTFNMIRYAKNSTILKLVHPNLEASLANESRNFIHDVI